MKSNASYSIVVLISGRGSNLQSIVDHIADGRLPVALPAVISNEPNAAGLARAEAHNIPTHVVDHRRFANRKSYDHALAAQIDEYHPDLVVLAGFMRIFSPAFVGHYAGRLINIHPSLLPAYRGLNTHARVLAAGEQQHGASVHFVTEELDGGPVIIRAQVPVSRGESAEQLAARVLEQEHRIYPRAILWLSQGRIEVRDGRALLDGAWQAEQGPAG